MPGEGRPRPVLAHHPSVGQSTACMIEQLRVLESAHLDTQTGLGATDMSVSLASACPVSLPPPGTEDNPGSALPGPPDPGKLTLWGWVVTPGPSLGRLGRVGGMEAKHLSP